MAEYVKRKNCKPSYVEAHSLHKRKGKPIFFKSKLKFLLLADNFQNQRTVGSESFVNKDRVKSMFSFQIWKAAENCELTAELLLFAIDQEWRTYLPSRATLSVTAE